MQEWRVVPNAALFWAASSVSPAPSFQLSRSFVGGPVTALAMGPKAAVSFSCDLAFLDAVGWASDPGGLSTAPLLPGHSSWSRVST